MNIEEVLTEIGYSLKKHGNYFTCRAVYRNGDNEGSVAIYPNKNLVIDFVTGEKFNIEGLIAKTLNINDKTKIQDWIDSRNLVISIEKPEPTLSEVTSFPLEWLNELTPDHSYWINRGIKKEILEELKGGIATDKIPRMKDRYCFGILNSKNQLIGLCGRSLNGKNPRYKIIGEKSSFAYSLHTNLKDIKQKSEVILIEGIPDGLSLSTAGIRNWISLFGVSLSNYVLSTILRINPAKTIICTNNDMKAGNEAARKIQHRLLKFFDKKQVEIRLPVEKDLNETIQFRGIEGIKSWYENKI